MVLDWLLSMASVETMPPAARTQNELLQERGKLRLEKFKQRKKKVNTPDSKAASAASSSETAASGSASSPADAASATVYANGNQQKAESHSGEVSSISSFAEAGKRVGDIPGDDAGDDVGQVSMLSYAEEAKRKEIEAEEVRRKHVAMLSYAEEAKKKDLEAEEARRRHVAMLSYAEEAKRKEREAEEARKVWEAEESKRKEKEAEEKKRQSFLAAIAKRREREAEEAKRMELEAEEAKRRELEAEEMKRKEREEEEKRRRQRDEEEARRKANEEFTVLEQHIQDLTEEKFALQRNLDKARAMAEGLASENSNLMNDFNNQGHVVNQLKEEIEILEGRIREQEVFARTVMGERDRAYQESAAALEQSQTLAGEVIALENRIRTLRSHELKMERDMGALSSEVESQKKQLVSVDKDRTHLKSVIDALQEEKKLLQVRLRKLASEKDVAPRISDHSDFVQVRERNLADAATSTEDLPVEFLTTASDGPSTPLDSPSLDLWHPGRQFEEQHSSQSIARPPHLRIYQSSPSPFTPSPVSDRHSLLLSSEPGPSNSLPIGGSFSSQSDGLMALHLPSLSSSMPPDVARTINNINDIITSLGEEKNALVKALKAESKGAAELRALNTDLSRKLEATTQQLELIVAQRMAVGGSPADIATPRSAPAALDYVDEGDEVVDRVFTWIMQLFPSRNPRRNMKRL